MSRLSELAQARTGDKGNDSIIGVYCSNQGDYEKTLVLLTLGNVSVHFDCKPEQITITALPHLKGFTVVVTEVLDGGVTRSLRSDPHGKTLGSYLLELEG